MAILGGSTVSSIFFLFQDDFEEEAEVSIAREAIGQTASWREADDTDTSDEEVIISQFFV